MYVFEVCVLIFPLYNARYVEVERDIYWDMENNRDYTFRDESIVSVVFPISLLSL